LSSAHSSSGSVSLVWLCSERGAPSIEPFEAVATATDPACEAILVGPPAAQSLLTALPDAFARQTVLTWHGPSSFAGVANRAAGQATGDYIAFLDDTLAPDPCWLDYLLEGIEAPAVDAATPRLAAADGSLLAAGSIVWADGTCEPLGHGHNPNLLEYSFRRLVPCALPACLLIRRAAFEACGGFDSGYLSRVYAAADLCFSLGARKRAVAYQPRAIVSCLEYSDEASGSAADLMADRLRFRTRWATALAHYPAAPLQTDVSERALLAARDVLASDRVLIVDDRVPGHDRGSGDPRMLKLLLEMVTLWPSLRLTFVAMRPIEAERYAAPLLDAGVEVVYDRDWTSWFEHRRFHYGAVIVSRPQALDALIRRTQPQAFRIYDAEALVFRRLERMLPFISGPDRGAEIAHQVKAVRTAEIDYLAASDLILCVTQEERRVARAVAEGVPAFVIPHWVTTADSPPGFAERRDLVFFGGFMGGPGAPNEDALLHLAADVLPLIHAQEPDVVLHVVGADPTPAVLALQSDRIHVVGYAPDPAVWLNRTRVHIVPMQFGSGVKLKLIDTMAAGLPFVTTAVGAEGLRLGALRRVTVAERSADLADLTLALYRDEYLWNATQHRILELARRHFGRARFRKSLVTAMSHVGVAPPEPAGTTTMP
jgi:glycosyltransferase involved in cell wall biosynthesis